MPRFAILAALALTCLLAPATAHAQSHFALTITPATPKAGEPFTVTASGTTAEAAQLDGEVTPADQPCEVSDWAIEDEVFDDFGVGAGPFTASGDHVEAEPGRYTVCVKLEAEYDTSAVVRMASITVLPVGPTAACLAARATASSAQRAVNTARAALKRARTQRARRTLNKRERALTKAARRATAVCG